MDIISMFSFFPLRAIASDANGGNLIIMIIEYLILIIIKMEERLNQPNT